MNNHDTLPVACAILQQNGRILALRRSSGNSMAGKWEFPGGKIEAGETPEACLIRELKEELELEVEILSPLSPVYYPYPQFTIQLYPFICRPCSTVNVLHDHDAVWWDTPENLQTLDWAEADRRVLKSYINFVNVRRQL